MKNKGDRFLQLGWITGNVRQEMLFSVTTEHQQPGDSAQMTGLAALARATFFSSITSTAIFLRGVVKSLSGVLSKGGKALTKAFYEALPESRGCFL